MARKSHPAMAGLAVFGERLKSLRQKAGVSQMKLAAAMGFDPTHGYKYILRLEKGLVPNPTLRTTAAYLEACGAAWSEVADVLPATSAQAEPAHAPAAPAAPVEIVIEPAPAPGPARRRDPRPMREQLRARRIQEQDERTQRYWQRVARSEEQILALLRARHLAPGLVRAYLAFSRNCCSVADTHSARPEVAAQELARLQKTSAADGLDLALLLRITETCTLTFASPD
jgi:transcriptional regulator with XRE-family HTH domain